MNLLCATGVYRNKLNDVLRRYLSWVLCTVRQACRYKWLSGRLPKVCLGWVGCLLACLLLPYISQNARKYPSLAAQKAGPHCLTGRELGWFGVQLRRRKQKVHELKWASEILFLKSKAKTKETFFKVGVVAHTFNPNGQEVKTNRFKMSSRPSYITEGKKLAEGWRELMYPEALDYCGHSVVRSEPCSVKSRLLLFISLTQQSMWKPGALVTTVAHL